MTKKMVLRFGGGTKGCCFDFRTFPYELAIGVPLKTSRDQREIGSGEDEEVENVLNVEVK